MRLLIAAAGALLVGVMFVPFLVQEGSAQEGGDAPTYVGSDACTKCHFKEHRYWQKTVKADSLKALKPGEAAEKKTAAGLDPAKDYSTDETCLGCHTTGYGKKGGYPTDVTKDADAAAAMAQIGCEACHGPGSKYVEHKTKELEANKDAKFTFEGLAPLGLVKPDKDTCAGCHNDKNPVKPAEAFDFDKMKVKVHSKQ